MANRLFARAGVIAACVAVGGLMIAAASLTMSAHAGASRDNDWGKPSNQGTAGEQTHQAPKCLDLRNVGRIHVVDDHTLLVYDGWGNPYQLDVGGPCRSMTDMSHIGFEVQGTDQLCHAHDAMLLYSNFNEAPVRCLINGVKSISRAEADDMDKG